MKTCRIVRLAAFTLFIAVAFVLSSCGSAASPVSAPEKAVSSSPLFMWHVEHSDMPGKDVHMVGSVHAGTPEFYPLDPVFAEALKGSEVLLVEIDRSQMEPSLVSRMIAKHGILPEGESLSDHISVETMDKLVALLDSLGIPVKTVDRMRPWTAGITLAVLAIHLAGLDPSLGIDVHLMARADADGIPIVGLETVEQQLQIFSVLSTEQQELFLVDTMDDMEDAASTIALLAQAWQDGDVEFMEEFILEEAEPHMEALFDALLTRRNLRMRDGIIESLANHDSVFVVVGAAHIIGEGGLVDLLEKEGFTVRQMEGKG